MLPAVWLFAGLSDEIPYRRYLLGRTTDCRSVDSGVAGLIPGAPYRRLRGCPPLYLLFAFFSLFAARFSSRVFCGFFLSDFF